MKNWILSLALLTATSLTANTIGFVEYDLPESAKEWSVLHQEEGSENILLGSITLEGAEFFGAIYNAEAGEIPEMAALEEGLQVPFPDQKVSANILESNDHSLLYEWSASDEEQEIVHGWGRIFCTDTGTVTLNYTTGQINQIEALRPTWTETLKSAHLVEVEGDTPPSNTNEAVDE